MKARIRSRALLRFKPDMPQFAPQCIDLGYTDDRDHPRTAPANHPGSLPKLWLGVVAAVLAAAGVGWAALPAQVRVETLIAGSGGSPTIEDVALINYKGTLPDGKVFDEQKQAVFPLQGVVPGFTKALMQMQRGGKYKVRIPSELGYGDQPADR